MKRLAITGLLVASLTVSALASSNSIGWKKGYSAAMAESKSSGKLIMIDFYTDWCGWCKKLDADTYPAPAVVKASEQFIPIKLNAEKDAEGIRLAKKFNVTGFPTVLFLDSNETAAYKIVGYQPAADFAKSMGKATSIRRDSAKYRAALKSNPNDFDALVGLAGVEADMGNLESAASHLSAAEKSANTAHKGKLLDAFNAVGDGYQNAGKMDNAIPYFEKAIAPGFDTQAAYARISIAVCYAQSGKLASAKPYAEALLKMPHAPKEFVDQAKSMLDAIKKSGK